MNRSTPKDLTPSSPRTSRLLTDLSMPRSRPMRQAAASLLMSLPVGWQSYFQARKYGRHLGVRIICPRCEATPPSHVNQWNRWRWLTVHLTTCRADLRKVGD